MKYKVYVRLYWINEHVLLKSKFLLEMFRLSLKSGDNEDFVHVEPNGDSFCPGYLGQVVCKFEIPRRIRGHTCDASMEVTG